MNTFPSSSDEFYGCRDDRTNRCTDRRDYQDAGVAVYLTPALAGTRTGQVMLLASANLLSRWCRHVTLMVPPVRPRPSLGGRWSDLADAALAQMRDADPFGTFSRCADSVPTSEIALCIGEEAPELPATHRVFINAAGWAACISRDQPVRLTSGGDENCLGAVAAACLGIGQVFKLALGLPQDRLLRNGVLDLFRLDWTNKPQPGAWPMDLEVGHILMVGAGSVGSSTAYCMRLAGLRGQITVLDKDIVKVENFNRSPIFGRSSFGTTKADATADFLSGSGLRSAPLALWWNEFVEQHGRNMFPFDVWLPLANEFNVRHSMQHGVPPLMIHASTTANWGVNHGRHLPGNDDCLVDRFPREVTSQHLACATGEAPVDETTIDAALPFASLFAGLLVTADLVRAQFPDYPQVPNFALFDWYGTMDSVQAWDKRPRPDCICRSQHLDFHRQFNARTRHWSKFNF